MIRGTLVTESREHYFSQARWTACGGPSNQLLSAKSGSDGDRDPLIESAALHVEKQGFWTMSWTDERVERLKKLWADGLSASQIAAELGGVSRNAVIGKVHRLNLPGRAKSGGSSSGRSKRVASGRSTYGGRSSATRSAPRTAGATALKQDVIADAIAEVDTRPIEDVVVPISRRLQLTELTEKNLQMAYRRSPDRGFCLLWRRLRRQCALLHLSRPAGLSACGGTQARALTATRVCQWRPFGVAFFCLISSQP